MFRPLYYLGCKANFADAIVEAIDTVDESGGRACDLFAGSGAAALALAGTRDVTTVDIQEYSRVVCSAQLAPTRMTEDECEGLVGELRASDIADALLCSLAPLVEFEKSALDAAIAGDPTDLVAHIEAPPLLAEGAQVTNRELHAARRKAIDSLKEKGLWRVKESTCVSYFGGVYFSFEQAAHLDAALDHAGRLETGVRDTVVAAVLSTASSIVNTIGKQFAQPIRPREKDGSVKRRLPDLVRRDRSQVVSDVLGAWLRDYAELPVVAGNHRALRMDYLEALRTEGGNFSVVYADPPYTRDHYSRFYHVLETMCLRDLPRISTVKSRGASKLSRGVYREDRHQSPFCVRSSAPTALNELVATTRALGVPLVLSYSPHDDGDGTHPRAISTSAFIAIVKAHYKHVRVEMLHGSVHNKLNKSSLELTKRTHAEMLVTCAC